MSATEAVRRRMSAKVVQSESRVGLVQHHHQQQREEEDEEEQNESATWPEDDVDALQPQRHRSKVKRKRKSQVATEQVAVELAETHLVDAETAVRKAKTRKGGKKNSDKKKTKKKQKKSSNKARNQSKRRSSSDTDEDSDGGGDDGGKDQQKSSQSPLKMMPSSSSMVSSSMLSSNISRTNTNERDEDDSDDNQQPLPTHVRTHSDAVRAHVQGQLKAKSSQSGKKGRKRGRSVGTVISRDELGRWLVPHDSAFRRRWDQILLMLILYTLIALPMEIAFDITDYNSDAFLIIDILVTLGFALAIVINFRTTVETHHRIITNPHEIAERYFRKWFWLDLLATVPWDLVFKAQLDNNSNALLFTRLLRLFRLVRLFSNENAFDHRFSQTTIRLLKLVFYTAVLGHYLGCAWFFISKEEGFVSEADKFSGRGGIIASIDLADMGLWNQYYRSFHWGLWALFSLGSELSDPNTDVQITLALVCITAGVYVFATIIGNIELLLSQRDATSIRFQEQIVSLTEFFQHQRVPKPLRGHILNHVHHIWRTQRGLDNAERLKMLPRETQNQVYRHLYKDSLHRCKFFEKCQDGFLDALCTVVTPQIALRGDLIIRQGTIGSEMYIINKGEAEAIDIVTDVIHSIIPEGGFFGEVALFSHTMRTISVRARTYMELYVVHKNKFLELLEYFPSEEERFRSVALDRAHHTEEVVDQLRKLVDSGDKHAGAVWDEKNIRTLYETNSNVARVFSMGPEELVQKFDANNDGIIDPNEQAKVLRYLQDKKALSERMAVPRPQRMSHLGRGSTLGDEDQQQQQQQQQHRLHVDTENKDDDGDPATLTKRASSIATQRLMGQPSPRALVAASKSTELANTAMLTLMKQHENQITDLIMQLKGEIIALRAENERASAATPSSRRSAASTGNHQRSRTPTRRRRSTMRGSKRIESL